MYFFAMEDDEAQVGFDELSLGLFGVHVALDHLALGALEVEDADSGVLLHALEVEAAVFLLAAVLLAELLGLGGVELGVEALDLALEGTHGVDGLVDLVEEALLFGVGVLELADDAVDVDVLTAGEPAELSLLTSFGLGVLEGTGLLLLFVEDDDLLLVLEDDLDAADGLADARLQDLLGEFFLVEGDDFLDVADAAAEVFAEADDLADDNGRAGDGFHDAHLAALDTLGDLDLALTGEQGDGAHLAEVHADGVVGFFEGSGGEVEFDVFGLFAGFGLVFFALFEAAFAELDALGADGGEEVVQVVGGDDALGEQVVDLAEGHVALFLAYFYDVVFVLIQFFGHVVSTPADQSWVW